MKLSSALPLTTLLGLAACGGADTPAPDVPPQNAFTGTVTVSGALPAGTGNCLATSQVVFSTNTVDTHSVPIIGGGCVAFINGDTAAHRVANNAFSACNELTGGTTIAAGNTFLAGPFNGPKTCYWMDTTHAPPPTGGGTGGGGTGGY
jgi:hypothetical protein